MPESTAIKGRNIIYLAANDYDTGESKTSTDHVAEQLAKHNRLLFVESIGMRAPRASKRDLLRIFAKLKSFFRKPRKINDNLYIYTPVGLPLHRFKLVRFLNKLLLRSSIRLAAWSLGFKKPILFIFLPQMGGVVGHMGETCSAYYCIDEYSAFPDVEPESVRRMEQELLESVDLCFATAQELVDDKKRFNPRTYLMNHGVAYRHFAQALDDDFEASPEITALPKPVIGFFGYIEKWMDLELVRHIALARPGWSIVLIGKAVMDTSCIDNLPNVYLTGKRHFDEIPAYGKGFDCCIIPFKVNEITRNVNPIKLWEYLSMGKPVVSTYMPAVERVEAPGVVEIGRDYDDTVNKIENCLRVANDSDLIEARQLLSRGNTWEARMETIGACVRDAEDAREG